MRAPGIVDWLLGLAIVSPVVGLYGIANLLFYSAVKKDKVSGRDPAR